MTATNRAAVFPGPGKLLEVDDVQAVHPGTGEVLIRNHAVALQPLDAKILISGYGPAATLQYPAVLGTSGAGVVEELGEGVSGLQVGDRVVFDTKAYFKPDENRKQGTWQQLVICDASTVAKVISGTFRITKTNTDTQQDWRSFFRASGTSELSIADGSRSPSCLSWHGTTRQW
jgi:NADPH:quinone reductase-like Zn-dependent oxidoreductase